VETGTHKAQHLEERGWSINKLTALVADISWIPSLIILVMDASLITMVMDASLITMVMDAITYHHGDGCHHLSPW
jgi:hypothetical protein